MWADGGETYYQQAWEDILTDKVCRGSPDLFDPFEYRLSENVENPVCNWAVRDNRGRVELRGGGNRLLDGPETQNRFYCNTGE